MANQIQRVEYEGYLVEDPEARYTPSGKNVTNFRIGSNRQYKNGEGETVKETTWLKVTAWGKLGEIVNQYCAKGSHVVVYGILRVGPGGNPAVFDLKNGGHGAAYEITASEVRILKGKDKVEGDEIPAGVPADDDYFPF
jgi:single-strand DNA-binding protein